jgi:hypothetical protein
MIAVDKCWILVIPVLIVPLLLPMNTGYWTLAPAWRGGRLHFHILINHKIALLEFLQEPSKITHIRKNLTIKIIEFFLVLAERPVEQLLLQLHCQCNCLFFCLKSNFKATPLGYVLMPQYTAIHSRVCFNIMVARDAHRQRTAMSCSQQQFKTFPTPPNHSISILSLARCMANEWRLMWYKISLLSGPKSLSRWCFYLHSQHIIFSFMRQMEYDSLTSSGDSIHPQVAGHLDDMETEIISLPCSLTDICKVTKLAPQLHIYVEPLYMIL